MFVRFWKSSLSLAAVALSFGFSAQAAGECTFTAGTCTANVSGYTCAVHPTQSGTCIATPVATGTGSCQSDTDCNISQRCTANACVTTSCTVSCGAGQACQHGQCVSNPSPAPAGAPANPYPFNEALIGRPQVTPNLEIAIPGVVFTPALEKDGKITINWIGEYIAGVYKYLLGIATTVAIVMIMIGGLQYTISLDKSGVTKAKKRINNAIIGLILLFSVYLMLFAVNGPRLTTFNAITLSQVPTITYPTEEEPDMVRGTVSTNAGDITGSGIGGSGARKIPDTLAPSVKAAAAEVMKKGYELSIASSFRSIADQERLIKANCQNPPGSATCNPKPGKPQTCILSGGKAENCPHTTGHALDIWGATRVNGSLKQCIMQADCLKDRAACRANPCQAAVIAALRAQGFCNLSSEPWHFEKPKMSSNCN